MPAPALHLGAVVMCSHAGSASPLLTFPRVLAGGIPVATMAGSSSCLLTGSPMLPLSSQLRVVVT